MAYHPGIFSCNKDDGPVEPPVVNLSQEEVLDSTGVDLLDSEIVDFYDGKITFFEVTRQLPKVLKFKILYPNIEINFDWVDHIHIKGFPSIR